MQAIAEPIRILKNLMFPIRLKWCAAFKTQRPRRKKGFSGTTRLCRICIGRGTAGALVINCTHHYGAPAFPPCGALLFASPARAVQGEYDVRPCRSPFSQLCRRLPHRERLQGIHVRGRPSAVRSPPCFPRSGQRQRDHLPPLLAPLSLRHPPPPPPSPPPRIPG